MRLTFSTAQIITRKETFPSRAARATLFERRRHPLLSRPNRRPLQGGAAKEIIAGGAANGHTCYN
jgi:hypothetical protein